MVGQGKLGTGNREAKLKYKATENLSPNIFLSTRRPPHPHATRLAIAFYYYNLIGGNYDDTFGNKVTPVSAIDGRRK